MSLYDLLEAFKGVSRFLDDSLVHAVQGEQHSVDEKIEKIQREKVHGLREVYV